MLAGQPTLTPDQFEELHEMRKQAQRALCDSPGARSQPPRVARGGPAHAHSRAARALCAWLQAWSSQDMQEGVRAFFEKRPAVFRGM